MSGAKYSSRDRCDEHDVHPAHCAHLHAEPCVCGPRELALTVGAAGLLTDLLSHDLDLLEQVLGYRPDVTDIELVRRELDRCAS